MDHPEIAKEILVYFQANPEAVDNLEGIARWCLSEQGRAFSLTEIHDALNALVASGSLVTLQSRDAKVYRLGRKKH